MVVLLVILSFALAGLPWVQGDSRNPFEWSSPLRLSHGAWFFGSSYSYADVSATGKQVYVTWMDGRDSESLDYDLYFVDSQDGGLTWSNDRRIDTVGNYSSELQIVSDENSVHIFLNDGNFYGGRFYYLRSMNHGLSWVKEEFVAVGGSSDCFEAHSVAMDTPFLYFVWSVVPGCGWPNDEVWFTRSPDRGATWTEPLRLWAGASRSGHAFVDVASSEGRVYVVSDAGLLKSSDNGDSWSSLDASIYGVDVEVNGGHVYVSNSTAYGFLGFLKSDDYGLSWSKSDSSIRGHVAARENLVFLAVLGNYSVSIDYASSFVSGTALGVTRFPEETDLNDYVGVAASSEGVHQTFFQLVDDKLELFYQKLGFAAPEPSGQSTQTQTPLFLWLRDYWYAFAAGVAVVVTLLVVTRGIGRQNEQGEA